MWLLWLVLAVVLGVAEAMTLTSALLLLGGAALVTAGVAAIGVPIAGQLVVFAVVSVAGIVLVRPITLRHTRPALLHRFGTDALVGSAAVVVTDVSRSEGTVRIGGEEWTARPLDEHAVISAGTAVDVIRIDGATAVVYPRE